MQPVPLGAPTYGAHARGVKRQRASKNGSCYAWLSPEQNWGDKFLWLRRKSGRRIGRAFSCFICCTEWPTHLLPKFLPIYHSMSCGWNYKISSPRASGVGEPQLLTLDGRNRARVIAESIARPCVRSRPGKPNQRKGKNGKFMSCAHSCDFWCFSLGKQARFTLNFCSRMTLWKVHELTLRAKKAHKLFFYINFLCRPSSPGSGKSHPWTNTSVRGNYRRTFRTIGPYEFPQEKVWTNDWSIWISPEIRMDQWCSKLSESFSLDRYWSIECSSLGIVPGTNWVCPRDKPGEIRASSV